MAKNPGQVGANATWDGPHQPTNLKEGNPRYGYGSNAGIKRSTTL